MATRASAGHLTQRGLTFDAQLAELAAGQHGVFALRQACELGVTGAAIRQRALNLDRAVHVTMVRGIPVTMIPRTLLDLAAVVPRRQLARALHQAEVADALDVAAVVQQCDRNPAAPGTRLLRGELGLSHDATASPLEDRFLAAWCAAGGPEPECNAYVDPGDGGPPLRPDFVWRDARTAVETDGRGTHDTRHGFEDDRLRDQRLTAAGWVVIRVTDRQLKEEPTRVLRLVQTLIVRRRP